MKAAKRKIGWFARFRRARKVLRALTKADPVAAAQVEAPPQKPAQVHRVVTAAEVIKRVGEIKIYEEDGDRLLQFAPKGWHAEESFATPRNAYRADGSLKPSSISQRPVFRDVGTMTERAEKESK